jgi:hypothetical protein
MEDTLPAPSLTGVNKINRILVKLANLLYGGIILVHLTIFLHIHAKI